MASSSEATVIPVADCEPTDVQEDVKPEVIELTAFLSKAAQDPKWCLQRTLQYAQDPTKYLKEKLGEEVFQQRRAQLCIQDTLDRDMYGTGVYKQGFEQHIANLVGKKHGLFFVTGVQAQMTAMRIHCEQIGNYRVAWHASSHPESAEEDAYKTLYGFNRILLGSNPDENPTVQEIKEVLARPEACRPAVVFLEIPNRTLGCKTYAFEDLQVISEECRKANVRLHCDGARLWEIEPFYQVTAGKSFKDIGALFDSVYVSFYKGLGGSSGAVLTTNDPEVVDEGKKWQRRAGGNVFTAQYQIIDAERGYNENIGEFPARRDKMTQIVEGIKQATREFRTKAGSPYVQFVPESATCCQIHTLFEGFSSDELMVAKDRAQEKTQVQVFARLRPKQTLDEQLKQERAAKAADTASKEPTAASNDATDKTHFTEWMVTGATAKIDTDSFVKGYVALCEELAAMKNEA